MLEIEFIVRVLDEAVPVAESFLAFRRWLTMQDAARRPLERILRAGIRPQKLGILARRLFFYEPKDQRLNVIGYRARRRLLALIAEAIRPRAVGRPRRSVHKRTDDGRRRDAYLAVLRAFGLSPPASPRALRKWLKAQRDRRREFGLNDEEADILERVAAAREPREPD